MATKEESQVNEAPEEVVAQQTEAADEVEVVEVEETAEGYEPDEKPEGVSVKVLTDMQRQIEELKREKTEQEDLALRTTAEMQNLRRRVERDVENAHKYALEKFVQDLLPVLDSLDRGIETVPEDDEAQKAAREGLVLTQKMLTDCFAKFSVECVDPTGSAFDPQFHEAITMVPNPDVAPNTVLNTVQKGYTLNGRLVRPAMVVVSQSA
ncbi:MAG TPA: nucleotide exchange factor GrpE [Gammaproteobacteria bacterium]|nr:nucleotide exchange factor GrpE [Gammaproteobacteria bacterium]MEC8009745.1 nucleotide exchange factor GrpE [Pseudomonadota bacterium]HBF09103.1 nucleotide exchange factor GrpE [Gammaproteobacteria bacterium]HCK92132.1 nucleotide exchange factor GrpE [Gammaproteobacteria bacterium]|tara:strand:+ start:159 stop:785 length:627 start_codon:yes stop_codon:yes gene_type:complete